MTGVQTCALPICMEVATSVNPLVTKEMQTNRITSGFGLSRNKFDSIRNRWNGKVKRWTTADAVKIDTLFKPDMRVGEISAALNAARNARAQITQVVENSKSQMTEFRVFQIQWHKIFANSISCLIMFLIGAPLGAIIKKGGLGFPVLASIIFFIIFYVLSIIGEKWAKQDVVYVWTGMWAANVILFLVGLVFLVQARKDRKSTRLNSSHIPLSRMPSSA